MADNRPAPDLMTARPSSENQNCTRDDRCGGRCKKEIDAQHRTDGWRLEDRLVRQQRSSAAESKRRVSDIAIVAA
jgi:hypothetical protein